MNIGNNTEQPLVSIVIPTWQRNDLLFQTLQHISQQTYKNFEVIVVVDGPDSSVANRILNEIMAFVDGSDSVNLIATNTRVVELGRNWSGLDRSSFGIAPLLVGYLCALGEYVMPWCDDERALIPEHIEKLVNLIETPLEPRFIFGWDDYIDDPLKAKIKYFDFVYPKVKIWRNGDPDGPETTVIGKAIPEHGQITHYLFRASNLFRFGYPDWGSHPVDWSLIQKWMRNGATWAFLDELTFDHRLDQ